MDVVRQNVKDLGGRISIESKPGQGCVFTLRYRSLAIADGMIVTVGDQTVVIPLTHVLESLRPEDADVQHIGKDLMVLNNRGKFLPIVRLRSFGRRVWSGADRAGCSTDCRRHGKPWSGRADGR